MKTKSIISLLQEAEDAQNQIKTYLKDIQNEIEDDKKEKEELKEKVEELEEKIEYLEEEVEEMKETEEEYSKEAEENITQLFLFHEFLRCSDLELVFSKFCADLEEFGDVALGMHLVQEKPFMPDGDLFEDVA